MHTIVAFNNDNRQPIKTCIVFGEMVNNGSQVLGYTQYAKKELHIESDMEAEETIVTIIELVIVMIIQAVLMALLFIKFKKFGKNEIRKPNYMPRMQDPDY